MEMCACPSCGAPAEVEARFRLPGAGGRVEHVRVRCVRRHWYLLPSRYVPGLDPAGPVDVPPQAA